MTSGSQIIKQKAKDLGFDFCGISKAQKLENEESHLEEWLKRAYHGKMSYMGNHKEKRLDPTQLVPGAKSIISLTYNYYPSQSEQNKFKIAKYAYGKDYHQVVKQKLKNLLLEIRSQFGEIQGRAFVDSAPVMERQWAQRSGLGWLGKNTLLLNRNMGSFFFLAELIIDLELEADGPMADYCGTCSRCMDACPTDAFPAPYVLDASRCISYFTIELKENIPKEFSGKYDDWIFGCDICQDVCPWNRFSRPHNQPDFNKSDSLKEIEKNNWQEITEQTFAKVFKESPIRRSGYKGLKRNIEFVKK